MNQQNDLIRWLPTTAKEMKLRNWDRADVILFSGDAYVDHPSFGSAVISRLLESLGLRVAIVPQPNWKDDLRDFKKLGRPELFFAVTSGCMDSMVNHYTAGKRKRSNDAYTADGQSHFRPDYATIVYSKILKEIFPDTPVVLGGIEASLRRVTHYDYWSDTLKPGILEDSLADLLVYGMGENPVREIVTLLKKGVPFSSLTTIPGTALLRKQDEIPVNKKWKTVWLNSHEECLINKKSFASNFKIIETQSNRIKADRIIQKTGDRLLIVNPAHPPMTTAQIDKSFDLPYTRLPHPKYNKRGPIPAFEMIKASINLHRGCFGGCSFCTISAHQGKFISSRSKESIQKELEQITSSNDFKGTITDMGGPSANMYKMQGKDLKMCERCSAPSCIYPVICNNLDTNHYPMLEIYDMIKSHPDVNHAFVGSGIRYDLFLPGDRKNPKRNNVHESHDVYLKKVVQHHVSGRLKVAPEHSSDQVLKLMRKPGYKLFEALQKKFQKYNQEEGLNQQLVPYFISSHPGSKPEDMANVAVKTKESGLRLEQIQDFTPTPMTVATIIYYSGYHPISLKKIYTARSRQQKEEQRLFFFWYKPEFRQRIKATLQKLGLGEYIKKLYPK